MMLVKALFCSDRKGKEKKLRWLILKIEKRKILIAIDLVDEEQRSKDSTEEKPNIQRKC